MFDDSRFGKFEACGDGLSVLVWLQNCEKTKKLRKYQHKVIRENSTENLWNQYKIYKKTERDWKP